MASRLPPNRPSSSTTESPLRPLPWWRSGWLWVAIGLLAVTLAAAVITTLIAMDNPDANVEIAPGETPAHVRQANP